MLTAAYHIHDAEKRKKDTAGETKPKTMTKNTKNPVILTIIRIAGFFSKSFSEKFLFILDNCSVSFETQKGKQ